MNTYEKRRGWGVAIPKTEQQPSSLWRVNSIDLCLPFPTACALFLHSFATLGKSSLLFSTVCALFTKTWGVGGSVAALGCAQTTPMAVRPAPKPDSPILPVEILRQSNLKLIRPGRNVKNLPAVRLSASHDLGAIGQRLPIQPVHRLLRRS